MSDEAAARLSVGGRAVRSAVAVVAFALVAYGSLRGHDAMFPFGPMSQYAAYVPPDGTVGSITVWADTTAGTHVQVALDSKGVGVKRADIEAQLPKIHANPSMLRTISTAQERLHPHQPQFVRLFIVNTVTHLHNREPAGVTQQVLFSWKVTS
jgi:hypothetical protein